MRDEIIQDLSNFFKDRSHVNNFFRGEMFKFSSAMEGNGYFESLHPTFINGNLYRFEIGFFLGSEPEFFDYSNIDDHLSGLTLMNVNAYDEKNNKIEMYFKKHY